MRLAGMAGKQKRTADPLWVTPFGQAVKDTRRAVWGASVDRRHGRVQWNEERASSIGSIRMPHSLNSPLLLQSRAYA
ncbi:hypothetical protein GCM10010990_06980 [Croceicoccus mobilis]|uniref:Uncharacterized protein n=1 Tax=Croceicoccus mobilis TaxID=1703339 RepID=A0A916YTD3_9SPHN|nr:hypothetical protein GCM10010990_06980 [Croceicoccus mobilis]